MKKLALLSRCGFFYLYRGCAELQQVVNQLPTEVGMSQAEIGSGGLKEALNNGISKQVVKLTSC